MSIKLKDVARLAEVSQATASLALNCNESVKVETRDKVKRIAAELGYSPNAIAQGLAKRKSNTIGLVIPDIESAYYGKLIRCIDKEVRELGYGLVLAISDDKPEIEKQTVINFVSQRVEGIIIAPGNLYNSDLSYIKHLKKNDIPIVFVSAHYLELDESYVMMNLEEGTYKLVNYLLDLGHRNIMFLSGLRSAVPTFYRINGYIKAFKDRDLSFNEGNLVECKRVNYEQGYDIAARVAKSNKNIDAIITINDAMALGVVNALKDNELNVPMDISVAGYDNMIFSTISSIPITTVNQDVDGMAWNAVNMLFEKIKDRSIKHENILIKPELIIRESTGGK